MSALLLFALIIIIDSLSTVLGKKISHWEGLSQRVFLFFGAAFVMALLHFAADSAPIPWIDAGVIFGLGCSNALAAYAEFRAIRINLSRTALTRVFPDIFSIALAVVFLAEYNYLNWLLGSGLVLCFVSSASLRTLDQGGRPQEGLGRGFFFWVAVFTVIWGIAGWATRFYAAVAQMPAPVFILFWYAGSALAAYLLSLRQKRSETVNTFTDLRACGYVALFGLTIWIVRLLGYELFALWPVIIAAPTLQIARMIVSVGIGCFVFHERRGLSFEALLAVAGGIAGAMLVALGAAQ